MKVGVTRRCVAVYCNRHDIILLDILGYSPLTSLSGIPPGNVVVAGTSSLNSVNLNKFMFNEVT